MSETIDPQNPKPQTRREALEHGKAERGIGVWGRHIRTTTEPEPDIEETGYPQVLVRPSPTEGVELKHRGVLIGVFTMVLVSAILFYAPFFNGLMGGVFGGFFAKRWGRAFAAAAIASVAVPMLFAVLYGFDTPDLYYMFYGLGSLGWAALNAVGMFIGAACGVYARPLAERRRLRRGVRSE